MEKLFLLFVISILVLFISCSTPTKKETYKLDGETHLKNITMLTEEGENAEAYFSFDESRLSFQAKVGKMECDQIFTMNINGTGKKMASTGNGRTTCAYYTSSKLVFGFYHNFLSL